MADQLICGRSRHRNHHQHFRSVTLVLISLFALSSVDAQYIDTRGEPNVNRPLMRWEQFQRQLRLNQDQSPALPSPPLLHNSLSSTSPDSNSLFTGHDSPNPTPLYPSYTSVPTPSTGSSVQWTRPVDFVAGRRTPIDRPSSSVVRSPELATVVKNRVTHQRALNTSNVMSGVQSASTIPNPVWRSNMIHLSRRLTNLTVTFTDTQFAGFLRLVHELSGRISTDCLSSTISLFYGLRRQQQWAVQSTYDV
jgi:hypothetical protein